MTNSPQENLPEGFEETLNCVRQLRQSIDEMTSVEFFNFEKMDITFLQSPLASSDNPVVKEYLQRIREKRRQVNKEFFEKMTEVTWNGGLEVLKIRFGNEAVNLAVDVVKKQTISN